MTEKEDEIPVDYLLDCLVEECGELLQAIGKYRRFGAGTKQYVRRDGTEGVLDRSNKEQLVREAADVTAVFELLLLRPVFMGDNHEQAKRNWQAFEQLIDDKKEKLQHYYKARKP